MNEYCIEFTMHTHLCVDTIEDDDYDTRGYRAYYVEHQNGDIDVLRVERDDGRKEPLWVKDQIDSVTRRRLEKYIRQWIDDQNELNKS